MVFVSCHLSGKASGVQGFACQKTAHVRDVEERNSQCRHISHSLFSKDYNLYARVQTLSCYSMAGRSQLQIRGYKYVTCKKPDKQKIFSLLTSKDQLLQEAERGQVFNGYCEGNLMFKPAYKYNVGSSNYDTSYKVRVPSWTDRILFKIDDASGIDAVLHYYESIDHIDSSDHKPVRAHLCLKVNNGE